MHLESPDTRLNDVIRKVGLVFQSPESQFFEVFVGDEIAYGAKQFKMDSIRERVREAMGWVNLDFEKYKDRRLDTLSGGEKRKVALASTLILQQDILLFDEPTAGMDPRSRIELLNLFQSLNQQGKTIIIATHRLEELATISDDVSLMQNGEVRISGATKKILSSPKIVNDAGLSPPLAALLSQKLSELGWPIQHCDITTPEMLVKTLEEVIS
jgi:energy-coupling factor transport system ATP-binding protein